MPATRPAAISNRVRLANKVRAPRCGFVPEGGTVDSVLPLTGSLVNAIVDELAPYEEGIAAETAEHNRRAGTDELLARAAIGVAVGAVVPLVERETRGVSILRNPPERFTFHRSPRPAWLGRRERPAGRIR